MRKTPTWLATSRRRSGSSALERAKTGLDEIKSVADLLAWSGTGRLDEVSARDLTRQLRWRGLQATPDLFTVLADRGEESRVSGYDSPDVAVRADALSDASVTLTTTPIPAVIGVSVVSVLAVAIAWYDSALYGLLALATGFACAVVVQRRFEELDRRLPQAVPRSGALGAAIAALAFGIVFIAVALVRQVAGP